MQWKRRYERVAFFCPLELTVLPHGPAIQATSFDISIGGLGLTANLCLERGTPVCVRFHLENGSKEPIVEEILGKVANSEADENSDRLGIEFLEMVNASNQPVLARKLNAL
jgi:hypothetical protein